MIPTHVNISLRKKQKAPSDGYLPGYQSIGNNPVHTFLVFLWVLRDVGTKLCIFCGIANFDFLVLWLQDI
jgi:hypothetical protein